MFYKSIIFFLLLVTMTNMSFSQKKENLEEINKVWNKFHSAFKKLDYKLMTEIHSKKLIRISNGKRISDYNNYINGYKIRFKKTKKNNTKNRIILRFFERINNDSIASERGIYKLIRINNKKEQTYYGQFHVLFIKENNNWKILMDYDSNETNSINEKDFIKAYKINELDKFITKQ